MSSSPTTAAKKSNTPITRSRGRPSAEAAIALNQYVTAVARDIFFEVGYGNATMDAIAQRARVSKETLYSRFPNKALLFEAVVNTQLELWGKAAVKHNPVVVTTSLEESIRHHVDVQIKAMLSPEFASLNRIILGEAHTFPHLARSMLEQSHYGRIVAVADNIRAFAEKDGVPARDPETAAEVLRSIVSGWLGSLIALGRTMSEADLDRFAERVTEYFLASRPVW